MTTSKSLRDGGSLRPFVLWLAFFYTAWLTLVVAGGFWHVVRAHWPIALSMAFGSYIAGSTPMGGGTVGFPVLVLLFDLPGTLGRNFGLAVQSIGMVSASIYILSVRQPIDKTLLRPAMWGAVIGTPLGAAFIAPILPDLWIKLTFAVVWASFGMMHLVKLSELVSASGIGETIKAPRWLTGFLTGIIGGIVSSITGVGIDMMIYAVMVLRYRADLKIAIPTSVILMAFTSVIGISTNLLLSKLAPDVYHVDSEVFHNWLAAAPVVAVGAPFGAVVVSLISRTPTLIIVSILCIVQYVWTIVHERISGSVLIMSVLAIGLINAAFMALYDRGHAGIVPPDDNH